MRGIARGRRSAELTSCLIGHWTVSSAHDKLRAFASDEQRRLTELRNAGPKATPKPEPAATPLLAKPKRQIALLSKLSKALEAVKKSPKHQSQLADFDTALQVLNEVMAYTHASWRPAAIPDAVELVDELLVRVCSLSLDNAIAERRARLSIIRTTLNELPTQAQVPASTVAPVAETATSAPTKTPSSPATAKTTEDAAAKSVELPVQVREPAPGITSEVTTPKDAPTTSGSGPAAVGKNKDAPTTSGSSPALASPSDQSSADDTPSGMEDGECVEDDDPAPASPPADHEPVPRGEDKSSLPVEGEVPSHQTGEPLAQDEPLVADEPLEIVVHHVVAAADDVFCLDDSGSDDKLARASELVKTLHVVLERIKASDSVELETLTQIEWCVDAMIGALSGDATLSSELAATLLPVVMELDSADKTILSSITRYVLSPWHWILV